MAWGVTGERLFAPNTRAIEWFLNRTPLKASEFYQLDAAARSRAFTISAISDANMVQLVIDSIEDAQQNGTDLETWKKTIAPRLAKAWSPNQKTPGNILDVIFRNAVQNGFNNARRVQMNKPAMRRLRPYRLYDSVRDSRRTDICRKRHGILLPADDPRWDSELHCPAHHQCRSRHRALRIRQALRRGGVKEPPADMPPPQTGFGVAPPGEQVFDDLEPDWSKYDAGVRTRLADRLAADRKRLREEAPERRKAFVALLAGHTRKQFQGTPTIRDGQLSYLRGPTTFRRASLDHWLDQFQGDSKQRKPTTIALENAPVRIRVEDDGGYSLIDGRHRWLAAIASGATKIRAIVYRNVELDGRQMTVVDDEEFRLTISSKDRRKARELIRDIRKRSA